MGAVAAADDRRGIVTVRTEPALPYFDFTVRAYIRLGGGGPSTPTIRAGNRTHHCYVQTTGRVQRVEGNQAVLTIKVLGVKQPLRKRVRLLSHAEAERLYKQICGKRTIFDDPDNQI